MLIDGIRNGEIRTDIDVKFAAKSIYILSSNLMTVDINKRKGNSSDYIEETADKIIDFVKSGISK
jgi:hypothetical protein